MSINRRTAIAVRSIGVASAAAALALGVAGSAFACNISEFTPQAACDHGKGAITVLNKDGSGTPVDVTISQGQTQVGTQQHVRGTSEGVMLTFPVAWQPSTLYTVHVVRSSGQLVGDKDVMTPVAACEVAATTAPPTTPASSPPMGAPATSAPASTPSPEKSSPAAPVADVNAPSPAAGGGANLAETGGSGNTGMIAGVAAALVALGGGAVFLLRRRSPAARH